MKSAQTPGGAAGGEVMRKGEKYGERLLPQVKEEIQVPPSEVKTVYVMCF